MADAPSTARACAWETTFAEYTQLSENLTQVPPQELDALERQICALQDRLLDLPAPDLGAVIAKLNILWDVELDQPGQAADERHQILDDLEAIQMASGTSV